MQQLCSCYTLHPCYYSSASYDASPEHKIMRNCKLPSHPLSCTGYNFLLTRWGKHSVSGIKTSWTEIQYPLSTSWGSLQSGMSTGFFQEHCIWKSGPIITEKMMGTSGCTEKVKRVSRCRWPLYNFLCICFLFVFRYGTNIRGGADGAITYSCCSQ